MRKPNKRQKYASTYFGVLNKMRKLSRQMCNISQATAQRRYSGVHSVDRFNGKVGMTGQMQAILVKEELLNRRQHNDETNE